MKEKISEDNKITCPVCEKDRWIDFMTVGSQIYLGCEECDAVFLEPSMLPNREEEEARYLQHLNYPSDPVYRKFLSRLADPLLERLPAGSHGLDYGCGPGPALSEILKEAGHSVDLYDPFFHLDKSPLGRKYDFVACAEVVEHFHKPAREFTKLRGLLVPGGLLGIMTCFLTEQTFFPGWHYRRDPTHVVFYRERTFEVIARDQKWICEIPVANVVFLRKPC